MEEAIRKHRHIQKDNFNIGLAKIWREDGAGFNGVRVGSNIRLF
jgi:hypothetical protein